MLFLLFTIGGEGYAVNSLDIIEVLPCLATRGNANLPDYISGVVNHRGEPLAVIDTGLLVNDQPCRSRLSTRIILVRLKRNQPADRVGLLAENATETVKVQPERSEAFCSDGSLCFEREIIGHTVFQLFNPAEMLPPDIGMILHSIHRHPAGHAPL